MYPDLIDLCQIFKEPCRVIKDFLQKNLKSSSPNIRSPSIDVVTCEFDEENKSEITKLRKRLKRQTSRVDSRNVVDDADAEILVVIEGN